MHLVYFPDVQKFKILKQFFQKLLMATSLSRPFQVLSAEPICSQCTLSLTPENIRNPYGFLMFSGDRKMVHWEQKDS